MQLKALNKKKKVFSPFQDSMKTSIKMELPPLKLYKFHFKLMLRQAFTTKPLFHPLPFLWCIILRWPCGLACIIVQLLTTCGANLCTIPLCTMEKDWGGGGEWRTETGKININVVSSWVLMSTTHGHLKKKYKINGQKEKMKREKVVKY